MSKTKNIPSKKNNVVMPSDWKQAPYSIFESIETLKRVGSCRLFSTKTGYSFHLVLKKISEEYKIFLLSRQELLDKYSQKDGNGCPIIENGSIKIQQESEDEFNREYGLLVSDTFPVPMANIKISEIPNGVFSPDDFRVIEQICNIQNR